MHSSPRNNNAKNILKTLFCLLVNHMLRVLSELSLDCSSSDSELVDKLVDHVLHLRR